MKSVIKYQSIGIIHTPFKTSEGTPIQPVGAKNVEAVAEVFPEYGKGLADLDGFSHLILLFHCHHSKKFSLKVKPFLDNTLRGLFATRAPSRPNSIGLSTVRLKRIEGLRLYIQDVDILDQSPLLDIKPYVPEFDMRENVQAGWFERRSQAIESAQDDGRFVQ